MASKNIVQVILNDELFNKVETYCKKYSFDKSEFVRNLIREKLFKIDNPTEVRTTEWDKRVTAPLPTVSQPPIKTEGPVKANCKNCGFFKLVSPHDFIFGYEQERIADNLCDPCWQKALQDGSAR